MSDFWGGKKVLVTGGAGMIGSHLVERLLEHDANVEILDNLRRGRVENVPKDYRCSIWRVQLGLPCKNQITLTRKALKDKDVVFHLAAQVTGIGYNINHNYQILMENLVINQAITQAVASERPGRFIFISTSCVYPHDAPVPTPEHIGDVCNPEATNRGYGIAKWVGEQQAKALHEIGIPSGIVRFFNGFGPRDYYDEETSHVVPALLRRFLEGKNPIVIWGTGGQTRTFVDCRDLAKGAMIVAEKGCDGEATNIGHQRETSIRELAYIIKGLTESDAKIVFDRGMPDGYPRRAADTSRFRNMSNGWEPDTPLVKTLLDMIIDYKERYPDGFTD